MGVDKRGGFRVTLSSLPAREQSSRSISSSLQSWIILQEMYVLLCIRS